MKHLRVTEILSPFTGIQYIKPEVLENACVRGTKVHSYCEGIAKGLGTWEVEEEYRGYVDSFLSWWGKGHKLLAIEKRFYCDTLQITGQADMITQERDGAYLIDIKTSQQESKSWLLQGSAYSYMAKKNGFDIKKILFLKLLRDGRPAIEYYYDENMELFKETLNVYRYFFAKKGYR